MPPKGTRMVRGAILERRRESAAREARTSLAVFLESTRQILLRCARSPPLAPRAPTRMAHQDILDAFRTLSIQPTHDITHHVAPTTQDGLAQTKDKIGTAIFVKNLFLRDKKHGLLLVSAAHDAKIDMKNIGKAINVSGANFRMADQQLLQDTLNVQQGSVSPLAVINDKENKVTLVLDKKLVDAPLVAVHPLRNDMTVTLTPEALLTVSLAIISPP